MIINTDDKKIVETLRQLLESQNVKVAQLARISGISKRSIFSLLKGESLKRETIENLFNSLGYTVKVECKIYIEEIKKQAVK